MKLFGIFMITAAGFTATAATAETGMGFNGGFGLYKNTDSHNHLNDLYGQMFWNFGGPFGAQFDLTTHEYDFDSQRRLSLGAHLSYEVSAEVSVGAYYGQQDWFGNDYQYYGAELAYEDNRFKADGHIGKFEPVGGGFDYTLWGFDGIFLIGDYGGVSSVSSDGSAASSSGPSGSFGPSSSFGGRYYIIGGVHGIIDPIHETLFYIGGSAELNNGLYADLTAATVNGQEQIGFQLRKELGGGVPYHRRGWTAAFHAW
ncbi:hypothetical protein NBRC116601_07470 [Cognatishimia sp. WU-CL00825]|uniref:hypothetical protein n=1 Tax=Cognatishimia sp. WU-CL00825 TaxID=3127658 RepID=UPI0031098A07